MTGSQKLLKTISLVVLVAAVIVLVAGIVVAAGNVPPTKGTGVLMIIGGVAAGLVGFEGIRAGNDAKQLKFFFFLVLIVAIFQFFGTFIGISASLTHMESVRGFWYSFAWGPWDSFDWTETIGLIASIVLMIIGRKAMKEQEE